MTIIGSTNYSYLTYSGLGRSKAQTDTAPGDNATSRNSASNALNSSQIVSDNSASTKLSSTLWDLTSSNAASARDEEVWQDGTNTMTDAEQKFSEFANMNVAELIRAKYLEENNLTEEDLANMTPEQRAAIEDEIKKAVEQALGVDSKNGQTSTAPDAV